MGKKQRPLSGKKIFLFFLVFFLRIFYTMNYVADIAQLVRALGCGPKGRRFESGYSPHYIFYLLSSFFGTNKRCWVFTQASKS